MAAPPAPLNYAAFLGVVDVVNRDFDNLRGIVSQKLNEPLVAQAMLQLQSHLMAMIGDLARVVYVEILKDPSV